MKQCDNGHFYDEKRFDTCPYCQEGSQTSRTVSLDDIGKTVAVSNWEPREGDRGKTVGIIKKRLGIDPAVGFLVCVAGPHKGADYKLISGRNFIGRAVFQPWASGAMDGCICHGRNVISLYYRSTAPGLCRADSRGSDPEAICGGYYAAIDG